MRVIGRIIMPMVKEFANIQMVVVLKEYGREEKDGVRESILFIRQNTMENGKMIELRDKEFSKLLMISMKDCLNRVKDGGMAF